MSGEAEEIRQVAHRVNVALHGSSTPVVLSGLAVAIAAVAAVEVAGHARALNPEEAQKAEGLIDLIVKQAKMALQREGLS
jgi:hypothetical protein